MSDVCLNVEIKLGDGKIAIGGGTYKTKSTGEKGSFIYFQELAEKCEIGDLVNDKKVSGSIVKIKFKNKESFKVLNDAISKCIEFFNEIEKES